MRLESNVDTHSKGKGEGYEQLHYCCMCNVHGRWGMDISLDRLLRVRLDNWPLRYVQRWNGGIETGMS